MDDLIEAMAVGMYTKFWEQNPDVAGWEECRYQDTWRDQARAALAGIEAKGYAVVPKEIPHEMFLAAEKAGVSFQTQQRVWPILLAAAPKVTP